MTEQHLPSDPVAAACLGRDAVEVAAAHQFADEDPAHEQFYDYGRELVATLNALDDLTVTLTSQVARYGEHRLLRDDTGADPNQRLAIARGHLAELHTALTTAAGHANQFWSTIGHIGVEVDPHAPGDDQQ